ncbi:MAG: hypothetical protein ACLUOF_11950 [Ruminococcus sp.]
MPPYDVGKVISGSDATFNPTTMVTIVRAPQYMHRLVPWRLFRADHST